MTWRGAQNHSCIFATGYDWLHLQDLPFVCQYTQALTLCLPDPLECRGV